MEKDYDIDSDLRDSNTTFNAIARLDMNIPWHPRFSHLRESLNARSLNYNWGDAIDPFLKRDLIYKDKVKSKRSEEF